jgi:prolyl-tRNA synthetase
MGERGLDKGVVEYKHRRDKESRDIEIENLTEFLKSQLNISDNV